MNPADVIVDVEDNASPWPLLAGTVRARACWGEATVEFGSKAGRSRLAARRLAFEQLEQMEPDTP